MKFIDVSFSYKENVTLFTNINLDFRMGNIYLISGSNGVGKTTLLNLFFSLISPQNGKILVNDVNINDIDKSIYGNLVTYVNQNIVLLNNFTVLENIILNRKSITIKNILELAEEVGFLNEINNLSDGFNTIIKENGDTLSGGQKQKIAILRALCSNPKVIAFDEAFVHLDVESKKKILEYIKKNKHNKIILVISHDMSIYNYIDVEYNLDSNLNNYTKKVNKTT